MREIQLTRGKVALVDDEDFEWVNQFVWYAHKNENVFYAARHFRFSDGRYCTKFLHEFLTIGGGRSDHADGDGLNNQKHNLRSATRAQNAINSKKRRGRYSSIFKGVSWHTQEKVWRAYIVVNQRQQSLGLYDSETDAAIAYDWGARLYFGEFARLNFPV